MTQFRSQKNSILNKIACDDNWMLIFAMQMGFIMSDDISERRAEKCKFGQNMSSQNSKFTQIQPAIAQHEFEKIY